MRRNFVDTTVFRARNMGRDGNIDFGYWHDKSNTEKLKAAARMTATAFTEPFFLNKKIDRSIFTARKHSL